MNTFLIILGIGLIVYGLVHMTRTAKKRTLGEGRPIATLDMVLIGLGIIALIIGASMTYMKGDKRGVHEIEEEMHPAENSVSADSVGAYGSDAD